MFSAIADYWRLMRAGVTLARHDVILPAEYASRMPLPAKAFGGFLRAIGGKPKGRPGERLASALESLGPAYIKLGQFLATRPDVFGVETTTDLSRLKDKLPPFGDEKARTQLNLEATRPSGSASSIVDVAVLIETADTGGRRRPEAIASPRAQSPRNGGGPPQMIVRPGTAPPPQYCL